MKKLFLSLSLLSSLFLLISCYSNPDRINLNDNFSWAYCEIDSKPEDAENLEFTKLNSLGRKNLKKLVGYDGKYIWVKCDFEIPEKLKNKDLALFVSYIHFADKVWINNSFSGEYGRFPPYVLSAQYQAHFYSFPKELLHPDGKNTILIKIYCLGRAEISDHIFVSEYEDAKHFSNFIEFMLSICYMLFEGGMFASSILYMIMFFMEKRRHREYLYFSLSCLFTMFFASMFFSSYLPWYFAKSISFLLFYKLVVVVSFLIGSFYFTQFIISYLEFEVPKWLQILKYCYLAAQLIIVISAPNYLSLINRSHFIIGTCVVLIGGTILANIFTLFYKPKRRKAVILLIGVLPMVLGAGVDFIVHNIIDISDSPFYMYFGWQISIICYLAVLCIRFTKNSLENIYLNQNLKKEVEFQTNKLKLTAIQLESELTRAKKDLQMASIVQQKSFSLPSKEFYGWDIAVSYEPLSEVSGDMYDFYMVGPKLTGFSLFDVSGHGIAASLITMLSKNIVYQIFKKTFSEEIPSSVLLEEINRQIVIGKGNAENYLTGLLFQIYNFDSNHKCKLQLANAGHPYPFLYSKETGKTLSIVTSDTEKQYGAIGIPEMEVSFQNINFTMGVGDVLVCFTDGITEIENTKKQQFGRESVKRIIDKYHDEPAQVILEALISEMDAFAEGKPREDDVTVIVLKRTIPEDFKLK